MPRKRRNLPAGIPVHVIQRGNNRQDCFTSNQEKRALANWLVEGAKKYDLEIHAWVFMTNHLHLLITPGSEHSISRFMQYWGRYYVRYFNRRFHRTGTLFDGRFKSHLVQSSHYFLRCCIYIELNPVRAGMAKDPAQYAWSSYTSHAFGKTAKIWTPHSEYLSLGDNPTDQQRNYRRLVAVALDRDTLGGIEHAISTGFAFGDQAFLQKIERLSGVPQFHQKRGRKRHDKAR